MKENDYIEIDLLEILNKLVKYINEQLKLLYVTLFFCFLIASAYIYLKPEKYMTTFENSVSYSLIPKVKIEGKQLVEMVSMLFEDNSTKEYLANQLNLPYTTLKKVKRIKMESISENEFSMIVNLTIEGEDAIVIDSVSKSIEAYVYANPFIKAKTERQIADNKYLLSLVNNKIANLDSLALVANNRMGLIDANSAFLIAFSNSLNQMNYVELIDKKQELEEKILQEEKVIQIIAPESQFITPISGLRKKILLYVKVVSAGLVLFLFYLFILKVKSNLKKHQR